MQRLQGQLEGHISKCQAQRRLMLQKQASVEGLQKIHPGPVGSLQQALPGGAAHCKATHSRAIPGQQFGNLACQVTRPQ